MGAVITQEQMMDTLNTLYNKAIDGVPLVSKSIDDFTDEYLNKYSTPEKAAKALINNQILKCGTSGFVSGLGGIITLPVALPANITSVLYVQLRMVAAIAKIGGYDVTSDQVQTFVYICLTGSACSDIAKKTGLKLGEKIAVNTINKISGKTLTAINQKVGFRLITKFGEKGIINLGKMVPLAGGVVGGTLDIATTKIIANNAYNLFINGQI